MSFATRATDVSETPKKGEAIWIDGACFYWGHRYKAFDSMIGTRVSGRLQWSAVADPKPVLILDVPVQDTIQGSGRLVTMIRPNWWTGLSYMGE